MMRWNIVKALASYKVSNKAFSLLGYAAVNELFNNRLKLPTRKGSAFKEYLKNRKHFLISEHIS